MVLKGIISKYDHVTQNVLYLRNSFVERLRKMSNDLGEDGRSLSTDLNPGPSKYIAERCFLVHDEGMQIWFLWEE